MMAKDDRGKDNRPQKDAAKPLPTGSGPAKPADAALKAAGSATPKPVIDLEAREISRPDAAKSEPVKTEPAKPMASDTAKPAEKAPGATSSAVPPASTASASAAAGPKPADTMKS